MDVLCAFCGEVVSGRRHALQCDGCGNWQHRLCETDVDLKTYRQMTKKQRDGATLTWYCLECKDRRVTKNLTIPRPSVDEDAQFLVDVEHREADMDVSEGLRYSDHVKESVMSSSPEYTPQAYNPPLSLWRLVEKHVPEHEREEVRSILGHSLVDQSLELHTEVDTLLDIWRDYRADTRHEEPLPHLPEPPGVRERLVQEIQFFVQSVKERASRKGLSKDDLFRKHNAKVLDYALDNGCVSDTSRSSSRLDTCRGDDGRETPMLLSTDNRSCLSSALSEDVESMNDKLNMFHLDEVVEHLRETLTAEVETLLHDISFLQNCLDDEATFRAETIGTLPREPTITELREERSSLEKELLANNIVTPSPTVRKSMAAPPVLRSVIPNGSRKVSHDSSERSQHVKPSPLKAMPLSRTGADTSYAVNPGRPADHKLQTGSKADYSGQPKLSTVDKRTQRISGSAQEHSDKKLGIRRVGDKDTIASVARGKVVAVGTVRKSSLGESSSEELHLLPSPPSSAKPTGSTRPSSAQRFRKMVLECRE